jgi:hypothetical protein
LDPLGRLGPEDGPGPHETDTRRQALNPSLIHRLRR